MNYERAACVPHGLRPLDSPGAYTVVGANIMYHSLLPAEDSTFERHYSIADLARQWRMGRETVRLLIKDEPGVLKIRLGRRKALTRYSIPESVARRVHTRLLELL